MFLNVDPSALSSSLLATAARVHASIQKNFRGTCDLPSSAMELPSNRSRVSYHTFNKRHRLPAIVGHNGRCVPNLIQACSRQDVASDGFTKSPSVRRTLSHGFHGSGHIFRRLSPSALRSTHLSFSFKVHFQNSIVQPIVSSHMCPKNVNFALTLNLRLYIPMA